MKVSLKSRLFGLTRPGSNLSQRVVRAGFWSLALRIALRSAGTVKIVVLARILLPEDFGLMGIAMLSMALLQTFSQTGFSRALIQRTGDIKPYLNTAWTMEVLRALSIAAILLLGAPLLAQFFGDPRATALVRALALVLVLNGLTNIGVVFFEKELEFQKRFVFLAAETIAEVSVTIALAVILQSVWALVYGTIAGAVVRLTVSYMIHPYRPRLQWDLNKVKDLFRYGKWIFSSRIIGYTVHHLDDLIVGRLLGAAGLGLYLMAYNLSELATREITNVAGEVLFPAYSKLQERKKDLQRTYIKTLHFLAFLCFPMAGGFLFLAPSFTAIVLGDKWLPMVPALQLLILWGLTRAIGSPSGALFTGTGRPDWSTKLQLVRLALLAALIYPLTSTWGITGAAAAVLIADLPVDFVAIYLANRMVGSPIRNLRGVFQYPLINTMVMLLALYFTQRSMGSLPEVIQFVLLIPLGVAIYGVGTLISRVAFGYTIDGILTARLKAWLTP